MYQVRKYSIHEDWHETLLETEDACIAMDFATEVHAATMNLHGDPKMNEKHAGPWAVNITDEEGNSKWQKCMRIRCASYDDTRLVH